jgi:ubiquinone/menaquinone biosynthesis C-methylase UbiE
MRSSGDERVTRQFDQRSAWWDRIYQEASLEGRILRRRQQVALAWIDALALPEGSPVLEVGCGAGATAVELARRGHQVYASDRSPAMLRHTQEHAQTSGVGGLVTPILGDAQRLMFPTGVFDLVLALGVLSWLQEPNVAIKEMARVTRPGGHVLVTSLNSLDLARLLDPTTDPPVRAGQERRTARGRRTWSAPPGPGPADPTPELVGSMAPAAQRAPPHPPDPVGFGPFTYLGKTLLPDNHAIRVEQALQRRADGHSKLLRSTGRLCLVQARKPDPA